MQYRNTSIGLCVRDRNVFDLFNNKFMVFPHFFFLPLRLFVIEINDKQNVDEIGTPPAPALLADSLTATSLSLKWSIPQRLAEFMKRRRNILRNYLIQWRYEEIGNDWKYCRNQSMEDNSTIHVENLQPFTKYRVRFDDLFDLYASFEIDMCVCVVFYL